MNLQAPIKNIIAADHELIRDGLQVMMKKVPAVEILGEAYNGEMLVKMTRKLSPEVILTDIKMPVMDGFEFLEAYKQMGLDRMMPTKIMMLTSSASFYDLKRLETFAEVKRHFSKPLADHDIKEIFREYFPEHV